MDYLISSLNVNGNQNMAKLRMSIDQKKTPNGDSRPGRPEERAQNSDARVLSHERNGVTSADDKEKELETLDMEFFPAELDVSLGGQRQRGSHQRKLHVFGQAENHRSEDEDETSTPAHETDEGHERARRRAAGLPLIQKTKISLPFPLLDSFPRIFARRGSQSSLGVSISLSTDTTVALRVKSLQTIVSRAIGLEEREALSNNLGVIAEAYEEGWDSGSDSDDD